MNKEMLKDILMAHHLCLNMILSSIINGPPSLRLIEESQIKFKIVEELIKEL